MIESVRTGFLLLLWCGIAATIVARPVARNGQTSAREAKPHSHTFGRLALDVILFPVLYAVALEAIGRADILTGAALGAAHATAALAIGTACTRTGATGRNGRAPLRAFLARTLYGIVFAFLYIVPAA